jgi:hypothetical protein
MNVAQLTTVEEQWLIKQRGLAGDKDSLYEQAGVYAAWRDIFGQYVLLAKSGDLEALKRALYLAWAERSMSRLVTGVKDLDEGRITEVFDIADKLARDDQLDTELEWMLPYYYLVERSYLDRFEGLDALKEASRERPLLYRRRSLDVSFDQRGQMGDYWKAEQAHLRRWS